MMPFRLGLLQNTRIEGLKEDMDEGRAIMGVMEPDQPCW